MTLSNNPPAVVLELSEQEAEWLAKLLAKAKDGGEQAMAEVGAMPSTDERAPHRATLLMAAACDTGMAEDLGDRVRGQLE